MNSILEGFFVRHQERLPFSKCVKSGVKGFLAILVLAALSNLSHLPLELAPFGASCILIFTDPRNQFSQPINVIGGYFIAAAISVLFALTLPHEWWIPGAALGVTISTMAFFRMSHAPAGAVPLLTYYYYDHLDIAFILSPTLIGSICLVLIALLFHRLPFAAREYPRKYS
jgi:CBS-domain-containing membrane protein